jgi:hypothetical protein
MATPSEWSIKLPCTHGYRQWDNTIQKEDIYGEQKIKDTILISHEWMYTCESRLRQVSPVCEEHEYSEKSLKARKVPRKGK